MDLSHCGTFEGTHPPPLDAGFPFPPQGPQPDPPRRVTRETRLRPSLSPHLSLKGVEVVVEVVVEAGAGRESSPPEGPISFTRGSPQTTGSTSRTNSRSPRSSTPGPPTCSPPWSLTLWTNRKPPSKPSLINCR